MQASEAIRGAAFQDRASDSPYMQHNPNLSLRPRTAAARPVDHYQIAGSRMLNVAVMLSWIKVVCNIASSAWNGKRCGFASKFSLTFGLILSVYVCSVTPGGF